MTIIPKIFIKSKCSVSSGFYKKLSKKTAKINYIKLKGINLNADFKTNAYSIAINETFYKKVKSTIITKYIGTSWIYSVDDSEFTIII